MLRTCFLVSFPARHGRITQFWLMEFMWKSVGRFLGNLKLSWKKGSAITGIAPFSFFPVLNSDMMPRAVEHFVTVRKGQEIADLPARRSLNCGTNTSSHLAPDSLLCKKNNPYFVWRIYSVICGWWYFNRHREIICLYLDLLNFRSDGNSR